MTWPRARVRAIAGPSGEPVLELAEVVREGEGNVARIAEGSRVRIGLAELAELLDAAAAVKAEVLADDRLSDRRRDRIAARPSAATAAANVRRRSEGEF
jgi:hypothetical protein